MTQPPSTTSSSKGTAPGLSFRRRWASAAVLSASLLVITVDLTILNVALPDLAADLRPTADQQLWIIDAYSLVLAGLLLSMSSLADRWGRKRMLVTGFAVFGGASALVLLADSPGAVIAVRVLLGVGGAMIMPTTLSLLRSIFTDPAERATALGLWAAVSGLGAAVGPIVGGVLLEYFSWRAAFLVNVPLMVIAIVAALVILPESKHPQPGRWDAVGALMSIAGMVALVWAIKRFAKEESLLAPAAWTALLGAVLILTLFVRRCLRRTEPLLDISLFRSRPFSAGVLAALGSMFGLAAALLLLAQWLQLVEGHSPIAAGVRLLPVAGAAMVSSMIAAPLSRMIGARAVVAGGIGIAGVGMALMSVGSDGLGYGTVAIAQVLVGFGIGSLAIASAMIMAGTPDAKAGNAAALEETAYDLGNVLGVAILGSVASILYRSTLTTDPIPGVPTEATEAAAESLGAAMGLAESTGAPALAERAATAFTDAMQETSLIGGLTLIVVAVAVFALVPRGTDVTAAKH
ncbi:Permease, MFS superfamily protein [Gordonia terrae C-6]|uniref:Permease, MFS superfamily protein n=1 Tax=Gordonia terrae C-6 TaxID=1316928 RepID=R7YFU6_9ACTN|nr:Permease, MFS superfamily protein [Gordonia terrae C-6]